MLDTFINLKLSNFSSLFEIAATLNLVFVVAEHAKQYGSTLTRNFFRSNANIQKIFNERYSRVDKETVNSMTAIVINDVSTEGEIQQVKREIHKLEDSKNDRITKLESKTENRCVLNSFSFISLFMFLYSLIALFIGGLNVTSFASSFYATFTLLSMIVLIVVSYYGEKEKPKWITKNLSLTRCCQLFVIIIILSSACLFYGSKIEPFTSYYWPIVIVLGTLLPYLSFVIFMFLIRNRLISLSADLKEELKYFSTECDSIDAQIHRLKEAYELSVSMSSKKTEADEILT